MEYSDRTLLDHIHGRLDAAVAAEVRSRLARDTVGGALHNRFLSLQLYEAVKPLRSYARHLCTEMRSPSPETDADDLLIAVFEKILGFCKKPQSSSLGLSEQGGEFADDTGKSLPKNELRPLQCRLQVVEFENHTSEEIGVQIDEVMGDVRVPVGEKNKIRIAQRFFDPGTYPVRATRGATETDDAIVSVVPLKRILRKTAKNTSSDMYLRRLTPKEQKLTGVGVSGEEKPRYVSRGDNFESLDVAAGETDELSVEETLLSQQQVDEMRAQVTTNLEFRDEAPRILAFIQSDNLNGDFREALLLFLNGASYAEIAEQAGASEGTARSRVCKARMALARAFPDVHEQLKSPRRTRESDA